MNGHIHLLDVLMWTPGPRGFTGLPAVLWGPPGIGKTSILEQRASAAGLAVETLILSQCDPADIGGLPVPNGRSFERIPWDGALRLAAAGAADGPGAVLFLDELTCAPPSLQAVALDIITHRRIAGLSLGPRCRVIAAANPEDQAAGGGALAMPAANRFLHAHWAAPSADALAAWMLGLGAPDADGPSTPTEPAAWVDAWARVSAVYAAALRALPALVCAPPKPEDTGAGQYAWPSPRTHELGARAVAGAKARGLGDGLARTLLVGAIGEGPATEIWHYLATADLAPPADVLAGRNAIPTQDWRAYAEIAGACTFALTAPETDAAARRERLVSAVEASDRYARAGHVDGAAAAVRPVLRETTRDAAAFFRAPLGPRIIKALTGPLAALRAMLDEADRAANLTKGRACATCGADVPLDTAGRCATCARRGKGARR